MSETENLEDDLSPEMEAEIFGEMAREHDRIDRRDYWRTLWRLIFGPGVVSDHPRRKPVPPEEWTRRNRLILLLVMIFGARASDPDRRSPDVDVITLWVSFGYGSWSSRSVGFYPGKWEWDFMDDGDSSL